MMKKRYKQFILIALGMMPLVSHAIGGGGGGTPPASGSSVPFANPVVMLVISMLIFCFLKKKK